MLGFLLVSLASAAPDAATPDLAPPARAPEQLGVILFDARVPAQVSVDGNVAAQLFVEAELRVRAPVGRRQLTVVREGKPEKLSLDVPAEGTAVVLVGRNGTSTGFQHHAPPEPAAGETPVEVRATGEAAMQLRIDGKQLTVSPGQDLTLHLAGGGHPLTVRNLDGTAIFATGLLSVSGGDGHAVVSLSEGRLPEVSGSATFAPAR